MLPGRGKKSRTTQGKNEGQDMVNDGIKACKKSASRHMSRKSAPYIIDISEYSQRFQCTSACFTTGNQNEYSTTTRHNSLHLRTS